MKNIEYIIFIVIIINIFFSFYKNFLSNFILSKKKKVNKIIKNKYIFLFPGYKEQSVVDDLLNHYKKILKLSQNIEIIFITTKNEKKYLNKNLKTTKEILEENINKDSLLKTRCSIIENEHTFNENKAKKINYALLVLREKYNLSDYTIGIFDFDAKISIKGFKYLDRKINNKKITLYQFVPLPIIKEGNLLSYISSLYHLKRVFGYEFNNKYIEYCMGASMFISGDYLKNNNITEPIDDISLGYKFIIENKKKITIPFFTRVTIPNKTKDIFNQMIPVYTGVFSFFNVLDKDKYSTKINLLGILIYILILSEYFIILLFISLIFINIYLFLILLLLYIFEGMLYIKLYNKVSNNKLHLSHSLLYANGVFLRISLFLYFIFNVIFKLNSVYLIKTFR